MEVIRRTRSMKEICQQIRARGRRIGFVATMGALHQGHLSLMRRTRELSDVLVVSIFVNPTQFGAGEDLERYPRNLAADVDLCIAEKTDYIFAPTVEEIYPPGAQTVVEVAGLSDVLEGKSRPGHFRGVATVVLKLFEIVQPSIAAFGQKDAQQCVVIQRMVRDLMLDVEILILPTVRDEDGLALSSRNAYLKPEARRAALAIPRALEAAQEAVSGGERDAAKVLAASRGVLEAEAGLAIDYLELVDRASFEPLARVAGDMFLVVAADLGGTRLIDNTVLYVTPG